MLENFIFKIHLGEPFLLLISNKSQIISSRKRLLSLQFLVLFIEENDLPKQMGHNQKLLWLLIGNPLLETFDQPIDIMKEILRGIDHMMFMMVICYSINVLLTMDLNPPLILYSNIFNEFVSCLASKKLAIILH